MLDEFNKLKRGGIKMQKMSNEICGKSLREMSQNEMQDIYGASSETNGTPATVVSAISKFVTKSSKACISASASAISGILSYNKDCLG